MADNLPYRDRNDGENADRDNAEEEEEEDIDETVSTHNQGMVLGRNAIFFDVRSTE